MINWITKMKKICIARSLDDKHTCIGIVILLSIIVFGCSIFHLRFSWNRYYNIASSEAVMLAQSLEAMLHHEHIKELSGEIEDLEKDEYIMTKLSLKRLVKTSNPIRFAYLMGQQDGNIVMLVDSETSDSAAYSPLGQIYTEANDKSWEPFQSL